MTRKELEDWKAAADQMLKLIPAGKLTLLYAYLKGAIAMAEAYNHLKQENQR